VPSFPPIDPDRFVSSVQPLLEKRDVPGLCRLLEENWTCEQIEALVNSEHTDAKKVALLAVGLVGDEECLPKLARQLRESNCPVTYELAEHAMWSIWLRLGKTPEANHQVARGAQALEREDFEHAISHFTRAIELDPDFAEAYNQRAIAQFLLERYEPSIADCERTVQRMPIHFGALAGMGHCYAHLGQTEKAIEAYERALAVHPHLDHVRQAVSELRGKK
jgi:tetratricopeptide (TPR) repeat protein